MDKPPIVKINEIYPNQNFYQPDNRRWDSLDLIRASKDLPVFDLPLAGIRLTTIWDMYNQADFVHHMKRVMKCDLVHPIILDDEGIICDGLHRICKALYLGERTIKAVRLMEMPEPSVVFPKSED